MATRYDGRALVEDLSVHQRERLLQDVMERLLENGLDLEVSNEDEAAKQSHPLLVITPGLYVPTTSCRLPCRSTPTFVTLWFS